MNAQHFLVDGMHCGACAARIEKALGAQEKVVQANVNFATKTLAVVGDVSLQEIQKTVTDLGYKADLLTPEAQKNIDRDSMYQRSFIWAVLWGAPVVLLAMVIPRFPGSGVLQAIWASLCLFGPGRYFFLRAWRLLRKRSVNMDTLVSLGAGSAYLVSLVLLVQGHAHLYFESAVMIVGFVLGGKYLEERARAQASASLRELVSLQPTDIVVETKSGSATIEPDQLMRGMVVLVRAGARVPCDGEVVEGESRVDESMATGEAKPVVKSVGDTVIGGTMNNGPGILRVKATTEIQDTFLAHVLQSVEDAQLSKAGIQRIADRVSSIFVPAVMVAAVVTLLMWVFFSSEGLSTGWLAAVAVLVIACPCALGLATPAAIVTATGRAAREQILIRDAASFERIHNITHVILDKTGTLTTGKPEVVAVECAEGWSEQDLLSYAYAVEVYSKHPMAYAVMTKAEESKATGEKATQIEEISGRGIRGKIGDKIVAIGSQQLLRDENVETPNLTLSSDGTTFFIAVNGEYAGHMVVRDPLREAAASSVASLREMGIQVVMATGDQPAVAEAVAREVGIDDVRSAQSPADKRLLIQGLRGQGATVAMIGDGINDAPALAEADVGIALGSGADVALDAAAVVIPFGDLAKVFDAIHLGRKTIRIIKQNLGWAFIYNVLAIPVAAFGLLSPMIAAAAMSVSSVSVVVNSLRLRS